MKLSIGTIVLTIAAIAILSATFIYESKYTEAAMIRYWDELGLENNSLELKFQNDDAHNINELTVAELKVQYPDCSMESSDGSTSEKMKPEILNFEKLTWAIRNDSVFIRFKSNAEKESFNFQFYDGEGCYTTILTKVKITMKDKSIQHLILRTYHSDYTSVMIPVKTLKQR